MAFPQGRLSTRFVPLVVLAFSAILAAGTITAQGVCDPSLPGCVDPTGFRLRAYAGLIVKNGGKCLDYTPEVVGSPIFLNDCSVSHPVVISQLTERIGADGYNRKFEVLLRAGTKFIGVGSTVPSLVVPPEARLELQEEEFRGRLSGPRILNNQTFSVDGDSIMLASDRDSDRPPSQVRVVKVQNSRGANGSPIVIGARELTDSEFWDFQPIDNTERYPPGFVKVVPTVAGLAQYLGAGATPPPYGTVLRLKEQIIILSKDPAPADDSAVTPFPTLRLPAGVSIWGDRRGVVDGPELTMNASYTGNLFEIDAPDTRISGVRLRGPSRSREPEQPGAGAILVSDHNSTLVDHNDVSDWPSAAIGIVGSSRTLPCPDPRSPPARIDNVRVMRNFVHDNQMQGFGYGVVVGDDGEGTIIGNTFLRNRHAITAGGTAGDAYAAAFNLVLTDVPVYDGSRAPDFDMHGYTADPDDHHHFGGTGGNYVDIAWNTFLGGNRINYILRGLPCATNYFRHNASTQESDDAIFSHFDYLRTFASHPVFSPPPYIPAANLLITANRFGDSSPSYTDPTARLGVGDFDGDGRADLFLATRAAFYFSSAGVAEWRLLMGERTDRIESLLFGDFDADGRTDVIGKNGGNIMVSWGGVGEWERLSTTYAPITDLAVGNFDGLGGDDIFFANGRNWFVSLNGRELFLPVNVSGFRVPNLRFGDFNGNGTTDVFGIVSGNWMFSDGAATPWTPLRAPRLTDDVNSLFIGDFNDDGRADVGRFEFDSLLGGVVSFRWEYWPTPAVLPGTSGGFASIVTTSRRFAAWGRFLGGSQSQLLFWDDEKLDIVYAGSGGFANYSRQDMK